MIVIAHRGNLEGPSGDLENDPKHVQKAINQGFQAEIDLWYFKKRVWSGHDLPRHRLTWGFLFRNKYHLWCHAKNGEALAWLLNEQFNCFWHQGDAYTLTSDGYIWAYPNVEIPEGARGIRVAQSQEIVTGCTGVCTDYPLLYKDK